MEKVREVQDGDLVANATVHAKLGTRGNATKWYLPTKNGEKIVVKFRQIINSNVSLNPVSENNCLPQMCPQGEPPFDNAARKKFSNEELKRMELACKMSEETHQEIIQEIERRETLDYEFSVYDDHLETSQLEMNNDEYGDLSEDEENEVDVEFAGVIKFIV